MMKQFTFAAILAVAASAMKSRNPLLVIEYESTDDYFLGVKQNNPVTMKMPRDSRARDGSCAGWTLVEEVHDTFSITVDDSAYCTSLVFEALADLPNNGEEEVYLVNDCGEEEEILTVMVQVYRDETEGI